MELLKGFKSSPSPKNTRAIPGQSFTFCPWEMKQMEISH